MPIIQTTKQLRPREKFDHYPTPIELCRAAVGLVADWRIRRVLDPGAGTGVWGKAIREAMPHSEITGIELRNIERPPEYDYWISGDPIGNYMLHQPTNTYDLIIGNPPFGDLWEQEQRLLKKQAKVEGRTYSRPPRPDDQPMADAEAFVRKAYSELKLGGLLVYFLRLAFLEGAERGKGLWKDVPLSELHVCSRRPSFTGDGNTDSTAYAVFIWEKGKLGFNDRRWRGYFLEW